MDDLGPVDVTAPTLMTRMRAAPCSKRVACAKASRECMLACDLLFPQFDREKTGLLDVKALQEMMATISGSSVPMKQVRWVMEQASRECKADTAQAKEVVDLHSESHTKKKTSSGRATKTFFNLDVATGVAVVETNRIRKPPPSPPGETMASDDDSQQVPQRGHRRKRAKTFLKPNAGRLDTDVSSVSFADNANDADDRNDVERPQSTPKRNRLRRSKTLPSVSSVRDLRLSAPVEEEENGDGGGGGGGHDRSTPGSHLQKSARASLNYLRQPIALWRYMTTTPVDSVFDRLDREHTEASLPADEPMKLYWDEEAVTELMSELNTEDSSNTDNSHKLTKHGKVFPSEVAWVMKEAKRDNGLVNRADLEAAVALWYQHVFNRRQLEDLPVKPRIDAGPVRRTVAAALGTWRLEAKHQLRLLVRRKGQQLETGHVTKEAVQKVMCSLSEYGKTVDAEDIKHVLAGADHHGQQDQLAAMDMLEPLAQWRCMQPVEEEVNEIFDNFQHYDANNSGALERGQVRALLTDLNEGIQVTWSEVDWVIEAADIDGSGALEQGELRAAINWWYQLR